MDTQKAYNTLSRGLTRIIITLVIFELALTGVAVYSLVYSIKEDVLVPSEFYMVIITVFVFVGIVPVVLLVRREEKLEKQFWKELTEQNTYTYVHRPYFQNSALLFQEGDYKATGHGLMGTINGCAFRFFQYRYTTKAAGRHKTVHTYCVAEVVFSGTFPHIYLNNTHNRNLSTWKGFFLPRISLPTELESRFDLHAPQKYEIEVLEIFTPDLLLHLADSGWEHDIELVDQKLYVFREKPVLSKQDLEHEVDRLQKIVYLLAPKLNRLVLTPIGDLKSTL